MQVELIEASRLRALHTHHFSCHYSCSARGQSRKYRFANKLPTYTIQDNLAMASFLSDPVSAVLRCAALHPLHSFTAPSSDPTEIVFKVRTQLFHSHGDAGHPAARPLLALKVPSSAMRSNFTHKPSMAAAARTHGCNTSTACPVGNREVFREHDTDGSGSLEKFTFEAALHKLGVFLPLYEVNALARKFAAPQGVNRVDYDAFLRALQLPLNDRRRAIVTKAWLKINPEGEASLPLEAVLSKKHNEAHPEVKVGKLTVDQIQAEFIAFFEGKYEVAVVDAAAAAAAGRAIFENVWGVSEEDDDVILDYLAVELAEKVREHATDNERVPVDQSRRLFVECGHWLVVVMIAVFLLYATRLKESSYERRFTSTMMTSHHDRLAAQIQTCCATAYFDSYAVYDFRIAAVSRPLYTRCTAYTLTVALPVLTYACSHIASVVCVQYHALALNSDKFTKQQLYNVLEHYGVVSSKTFDALWHDACEKCTDPVAQVVAEQQGKSLRTDTTLCDVEKFIAIVVRLGDKALQYGGRFVSPLKHAVPLYPLVVPPPIA
eukprot:21478-Heterococcus_DN1.PRE.3